MKRIQFTLIVLIVSCFFASNTYAQSKKVLIETNLGNITILLYDETPQHRDNFVKLVEEGFYEGLLFHRVINNFMIQGGDPESKDAGPKKMLGNGGPGYNVPAEFVSKYFHKKGALAAAREGDNVNPNKESSGSQFYIVHGRTFSDDDLNNIETRMNKDFTSEQREFYKTEGGSPHLDGNYTVFGEVVEGLAIIDKIATVRVGKNDRPIENVIIINMTVIE
jgi:cyclophilin family peptidyl-prolyl cis-trans isomerase